MVLEIALSYPFMASFCSLPGLLELIIAFFEIQKKFRIICSKNEFLYGIDFGQSKQIFTASYSKLFLLVLKSNFLVHTQKIMFLSQ